MKKSLFVISMMLVLAFAVVGCATRGDLEKVQSDQMRKLIRQRRMRRKPRQQPMRPR
jgi:hypothetical protein